MACGIMVLAMAFVAQAPDTGAKADVKAAAEARSTKLNDAHRLLRNGRYAEAEEALTAIEADARKAPGGLSAVLELSLLLKKAESQASQGEYARASSGLKAAVAHGVKGADLPASLADLYLDRGEWEAAETAMKQALKLDPEHFALAGWRRGSTNCAASKIKRSPGGSGSSIAITKKRQRLSPTRNR